MADQSGLQASRANSDATRILFSDIDGTLAHYIDLQDTEDGHMAGHGVTLRQDRNLSMLNGQPNQYCGTYECTEGNAKVCSWQRTPACTLQCTAHGHAYLFQPYE